MSEKAIDGTVYKRASKDVWDVAARLHHWMASRLSNRDIGYLSVVVGSYSCEDVRYICILPCVTVSWKVADKCFGFEYKFTKYDVGGSILPDELLFILMSRVIKEEAIAQ